MVALNSTAAPFQTPSHYLLPYVGKELFLLQREMDPKHSLNCIYYKLSSFLLNNISVAFIQNYFIQIVDPYKQYLLTAANRYRNLKNNVAGTLKDQSENKTLPSSHIGQKENWKIFLVLSTA